MTNRTNSIFVVGVPDSDPAPRQQTTPQPVARNHMAATQPREAQPTHFPTTPRTAMTFPRQTQQQIDAQSLRELTAISTNKALAALNTNPIEAAAALRAAVGYADRLLAMNAEIAVNSARQANPFHGYDVNSPMAGTEPKPFVARLPGEYDLNNPGGFDL